MARRTVRVTIAKRNPEKFLKLCEDIVERNTELGSSSPLADGDVGDMAEFAAQVAEARAQREMALEYHALAEAAMYESRKLMGIANGQTVTTPGTLLYSATRIKKLLLVLSTINPYEVNQWGFDVVVQVAKNRGRKKKE